MKTSKLLKRVQTYIDFDKKKQQDCMDSIKVILKKLKKNHRLLKEKVANEQDPKKCKQLQKECDIIHAQRQKGLKALKKLQRS